MRGEMVSGNYFGVLQVTVSEGRTFVAEDDRPDAEPVIVISERLRRLAFPAGAAALGAHITLGGHPYTIIGVAGARFKGTISPWEQALYWVPLRRRAVDLACRNPEILTEGRFALIARLQPNVTVASADQALHSIRLPHGPLPRGVSAPDALWAPSLLEAGNARLPFDALYDVVPERLGVGLTLLTATVLLIAIGNLAGVFGARAVARQGEIATRIALGASRWQVARQLLIEGLALSVAATMLGLVVANWLLDGFVGALPAQIRRLDIFGSAAGTVIAIEPALDLRIVLVTLGLATISGLLVAAHAAMNAARTAVHTGPGGGAVAGHVGRLRGLVLVPQIALSLALLVVGGLLVKGVIASELLSSGHREDLLTIRFELPRTIACGRRTQSAGETQAYQQKTVEVRDAVLRRAASVPGVSAVSLSEILPIELPRSGGTWATAQDRVADARPSAYISRASVGVGYLELVGVRLRAGRTFTEQDIRNEGKVAVVSETLARTLWPAGGAVGRQFAFQEASSARPPQWFEVIGIVSDTRSPLAPRGYHRPVAYTPLVRTLLPPALVAGVVGPPAETTSALVDAILSAAPEVRVSPPSTLREQRSAILYPSRLAAAVLGACGLIALTLAAIGIYGVVSYASSQRVREIGVRLALGATRSTIIRMILYDSGKTAATGAVLGALLTFGGLKWSASRIVAFPAIDLAVLIAVPGVLVSVIFLASYLPARRASRVDPLEALRHL